MGVVTPITRDTTTGNQRNTQAGEFVDVAFGGTGAGNAPAARTNLGAAANGANSDITSLTGLTTALSVAQGGTGNTTGDASALSVTAAGGTTAVQLANLVSVDARFFGCKFDGVTDDSNALQSAITAAAVNGLDLVLPVGTAIITRRLGLNGAVTTNAKYFRIRGANRTLTQVMRGSSVNTNAVFEFDRLPLGFALEDFGLNANNSGFAATGISSLVVYNCSNVRLRGLLYTDFTNSGLLAYGDAGAGMTNLLSERCHASGVGGFGAVGQLYANCSYSGFEDCTAEGIIVSPGYGLELKNVCTQSWIRGGWVRNSGTAVAFGQDIQATAVTDSWVYGTASINNQNGFVSGYSQRCAVTMPYIDMNDNFANGNAVNMAFSKGMHVQIGIIKNVKRNAAYFDPSTTDCVVEIGEIDNDLGTGTVAYFDTGSDRNTARLKRFSSPTSISAALFTNLGGSGNALVYDPTATSTGTIYPAGSTNISAQTADNTATGGNSRGVGAVDLQVSRTAASMVASGGYSVILGGQSNVANGTYSAAFGAINSATGLVSMAFGGNCIADGNYSHAWGRYAYTRATSGKWAFASGRIAAQGDAQFAMHVLRASASGTTPARATSDGTAASTTNSIPLPIKAAFAGRVTAVAIDTATYDSAMWTIDNLLVSRGASGAPVLVGTPTVNKAQASSGASGWTLSLAVDATNNGLAFTITGVTGSAIDLALHHMGPEVQ